LGNDAGKRGWGARFWKNRNLLTKNSGNNGNDETHGPGSTSCRWTQCGSEAKKSSFDTPIDRLVTLHPNQWVIWSKAKKSQVDTLRRDSEIGAVAGTFMRPGGRTQRGSGCRANAGCETRLRAQDTPS